MNYLVKHRFELLTLFILATIYFILRLPNLTTQPIFADEAIYIRWAQVMRSEPTLRFVSVTDGKTPLFMWVLMPLFKVFADPLYAGRFLSVISGFFTFLGVYVLSKRVFNPKVAFWSALFYVLAPFTVFFDRMALVDSMLAAFSAWSLYFLIWLMQKPALDKAMFLGYFLGGGVLTKTPAMVNILMVPIGVVEFIGNREKRGELLKFLLDVSVAIFISLVLYNMLRLGPQFEQLSARNGDYVFSPLEILNRPWDPFIPHLKDISDWFPKLLTWPILLAGFFGIFNIFIKPSRIKAMVFLWGLLPLLFELAFLKTFTARYVLTFIPIFLILAGFGIVKVIDQFKLKNLALLILILLSILPLYFDYYLITNIAKAPLPKEERKGYLEEWTAGYGFSQIANYLIEQKKNGPVVVATEGFFGTLPDGLFIYLDKANIAVIGSHATISAQIRSAAKTSQTFFVGQEKDLKQSLQKVVIVQKYPKAKPLDNTPQDAIVLYKVLP